MDFYQKDRLTAILPFEEIIQYIEKIEGPRTNSIYFSGTVPLLKGFLYGDAFKMTFEIPREMMSLQLNTELIILKGDRKVKVAVYEIWN